MQAERGNNHSIRQNPSVDPIQGQPLGFEFKGNKVSINVLPQEKDRVERPLGRVLDDIKDIHFTPSDVDSIFSPVQPGMADKQLAAMGRVSIKLRLAFKKHEQELGSHEVAQSARALSLAARHPEKADEIAAKVGEGFKQLESFLNEKEKKVG